MQIKQLLELLRLKEIERAGWRRVGLDCVESVADHSWGLTLLVVLLSPPELDRGRALALAVVHDLAEILTGDITPHDPFSAAEKHQAEARAIERLACDASELSTLWHEYEVGLSPEARFVKACDKLEMALQASLYEESRGQDLGEFFTSAERALLGSTLEPLFDELLAMRSKLQALPIQPQSER